MCELTYSAERSTVVDFTHFLIISQMTFISQVPILGVNDWITPSLANYFWLLNLCSFLFVLASLYTVQAFSRSNSNRSFLGISEHFWKLYAIFLRQPVKLESQKEIPIKLIYSFWSLSAFLLSSFLCYSFFSLLTIPSVAQPIDSIEELLEAISDDTYQVTTKDHSSMLNSYLHATPEQSVRYAIGRHLNRTKRRMFNNDLIELIPEIEHNRNVIAIGNRIFLQVQNRFYASKRLHIGSGYIELDQLALVLPKNSVLMAPFNRIIDRVREVGLIQAWLEETLRRLALSMALTRNSTKNPGYSNEARSITLYDLWLVFIVWFVGIGISGLFFLGEIFVYCVIKRFDL